MIIVINCYFTTAELFPQVATHYVGETASFTCFSTVANIVNIRWLLNESTPENLNLTNAITAFEGGVGSLRLTELSTKFNDTTIQCVATTSNSGTQADNALLLVQG